MSEEQVRAQQREPLRNEILSTLSKLDALLTPEPPAVDAVPPVESPPDRQPHGPAEALADASPPSGNPAPRMSLGESIVPAPAEAAPDLDSLPNDVAGADQPEPGSTGAASHEPGDNDGEGLSSAPKGEPDAAAVETLRRQVSNLQSRDAVLNSENEDLRSEVEALRTELFTSQAGEKYWRTTYVSEKRGAPEEFEDAPPPVQSVEQAVELAKDKFRQELQFAPNADSQIEGNPFNDANDVWDALKWLGTTYYRSKMGRLRVTDFDQSIKEACGWWYKGDQGETTISRYRDSYTARANGKRYTLTEHIGKGTTFDARYTIRIAFDWDKDKRQVIVGYIGRHQQTGAS